jgi:hypothetical protein
MVSKPQFSVYRVFSSKKKYVHTVNPLKRKHRSLLITRLLNGRYALVFIGVLSIFIVWAAISINEHSGIVLAMVAANVLVIVHLNTEPLVLDTHSSFRGFVLMPIFGLFIGLVQQSVCYLLALIILSVMKAFHYDPSGTTLVNKDSSWGPGQMATDVDANKSLLLLYVPVYCLASWFPCALVALAYRYDAAQAEQLNLSDEEGDQLVLQSILPVDDSGRTPILLQDAALHPSKISWTQLPTFLAALGTMIAIQVIGLIFDALTGWQPGTFFPTRPEQLSSNDNPFSINAWAAASYPFVVVAMIISVHLHPERTFRSLWSFHEKWYLDSTPPDSHPANNEGEELLEWRKLPAEEWISVPSS